MKGKRVMMIKKKPAGNCVTLDKIIGITSKGNNSIAVNPVSSEIAYIASGVISFYSPLSNKQEYYLFNQNSKVFSCLAFSTNGKYLATGEGTCKQPEIAIWEFIAPKQPVLIKKLRGHKYGVEWVVFSPDSQTLVSLGNQHDQGMFIWNWQQEKRLCSNKITKRMLSIAFSSSGDFFITGGVKSIKMWSFDKGKPITTTASMNAETKCMASKNVDLAEMVDKTFVNVAINKDSIFGLTQDGILCVFSTERLMYKWMDLHAGSGYALTTVGKYLMCGCSDGIIRCFDSESLEHITTLPRPPPLGQANISPEKKRMVIPSEPHSLFADTVGLLLFENNTKLYTLYSDRTVFTWDISKLDNISVYRSSLHHSAAINQIQMLPTSTMEVTKFATGSNDKTIRFWHLCHSDSKEDVIRNVYSKEMSRIIYVTKNFEHFKQKPAEGEGCIKCIACSPDGKHIASGDSEGVLRVYSIENLEELILMQAHDSDIVSLDYNMHTPREGEGEKGRNLMASGSRDRLIHVFDVENQYKPIMTIDDHSSSIADLAFVRVDSSDKLISCGADRSLVFRTILANSAARYYQTIQKSKKCYTIQSHPIHKTIIIGEDKSLKVLLVDSGKLVKEIEEYQDKTVKVVNDSNLKLTLDASGLILAVCNLDRTVRLIDYYSGKVLGKINVGEIVTSLAFSPNGKKLLTTTNDGCIFIWRLSLDLTNAIRARMTQAPVSRTLEIEGEEKKRTEEPKQDLKTTEDIKQVLKPVEEPGIRCHESIMPNWAKAEPTAVKKSTPFEIADDSPPIPGKWGKPVRIDFSDAADSKKFEFSKNIEDDSEEEKVGDAVAFASESPRGRDSFVVTKSTSFAGNKKIEKVKEEEEVKEEAGDEAFLEAEEVEEEEEENQLPELEPESTFVKNPLRASLSSSFWQKKQEEPKAQVGFFQYEHVDVEPWHVPKVGNLKKKKEIEDVSLPINNVKDKLREFGILSMQKKPPVSKPKEVEDIEPDILCAEIVEDIPEEIAGDKSDEIIEDIVESPKAEPKTQLDVKKFDSPYTKHPDMPNESKSYIGFSLSESQFSQSSKPTKDQYKQGFVDLKNSLKNVYDHLDALDTTDPEYSVSFEESHQELEDISKLLINISGKLGRQLAYSKENELIEKFSKKLVGSFEKRLRKKEKSRKRDKHKEKEEEKE